MLDTLREWLTGDDEQTDDPLDDYDRDWLDDRSFTHLTLEDVPATARCDVCGRLFDELPPAFDHVSEHGRDPFATERESASFTANDDPSDW